MNNDTYKKLRKRFLRAKREHGDKFELFRQSHGGLAAEKIMDDVRSTPLGRLLGIIASLPEVRLEKVERGIQLSRRDESDLDEPLAQAMDRVLEDLLQEG